MRFIDLSFISVILILIISKITRKGILENNTGNISFNLFLLFAPFMINSNMRTIKKYRALDIIMIEIVKFSYIILSEYIGSLKRFQICITIISLQYIASKYMSA